MKFPRQQAILTAFGISFGLDRIIHLEFGVNALWLHLLAACVFVFLAFWLEHRYAVLGQEATNRAFSQNALLTSIFFGLIGVLVATLLKVGVLATAFFAIGFALAGLLGTRVLEPKRQ